VAAAELAVAAALLEVALLLGAAGDALPEAAGVPLAGGCVVGDAEGAGTRLRRRCP